MAIVWDVLASFGTGLRAALLFTIGLFGLVLICDRLCPPQPKPQPKLRHVCTRREYIDPDTGNERILWLSSLEPVQEAEVASPDAV